MRQMGVIAVTGLCLALAPSAGAAKLGKAGGFTYVKKSATLDAVIAGTTDDASIDAECPKGTKPVGGGAEVSGDPLNSYLSASGPDLTDWHTAMWHFDEPEAKASAYAICSKKKSKIRVEKEDLTTASGTGAAFAVPCGNDAAVSGGATPAGFVVEWWLSSTDPDDGPGDMDEKPDDVWTTFAWHRAGYLKSFVRMQSVCMKGAKPKYPDVGTAFSTQQTVTHKVPCPKKTVVVGGGGESTGPASQNHLSVSVPYDSGDKGKVPDDGWKVTYANPGATEQDFVSSAVCL